MAEKRQRELSNIINQRCYRNQSIKTQISDLSIAESTAHQYDHIASRITHWSSFYLNSLLNNLASQHLLIYLHIYSAISSTIARVFYSLQSEKDFEIYGFADQINVFSSISFETVHRLVRSYQHLFIICSTIFSRNCTSVIFITIWDIWSKHTRLQIKSTRSLCFRSKMHVMNLYRKFPSKTILTSKSKIQSSSFLTSLAMNILSLVETIKIIAEKRDFEKSSSIAYEDRLTNLQNWNESTTFVDTRVKKLVAVVGFQNYDRITTKCIHCYLSIFQ